MSTGRARANHKLYLARIVITGWDQALAAEQVPADQLARAYLPAVREHLLDAYGWFLLEVAAPEQWPERPPHSCAQLPPQPEGRAVPGEIREFQQLESQSWLSQLLAEPSLEPRVSRGAGNLAISSEPLPDPDEVLQWLDRLDRLFDRMGDSLDEY